jgi:catechol 2,3-dioxygenase-like lactoylglutathione lyase family enzyme
MIGYVTLGTDDLDRARAYFAELLGSIGGKEMMRIDDDTGFTMYGTGMDRPGIVVLKPFDGAAADPGNGNMIAIPFTSTDKVDAFHARALELGGSEEGAPGYRGDPAHGYYFAYFRDPDGHKFAAFNVPGMGA